VPLVLYPETPLHSLPMKSSNGARPGDLIARLPTALQASAERRWRRIVEQDPEACADWQSGQCSTFATMLACSEYAAQAAFRHWNWMNDAVARGAFDGPLSVGAPSVFDGENRPLPEDDVRRLLRQARHRSLLGILWREYAATVPVTWTLQRLSDLADALITAATAWAEASMAERFGYVVDEQGRPVELLTLAMGKLGGRELNFSSDIDVVFLYTDDGESNGPRGLSAQEYFTRLARRIVSLLDDVTEDGFVYRVDTRLRPFGDSGPLVVSFASFESYLLQHGRSWERYAYVKARAVGGDTIIAHAEALTEQLIGPFVYRRYLDYGVFESLREMKVLIEDEVRKRELSGNIKLGRGGIREIEFIVQSLQLVRGGGNHNLRCQSLLRALEELTRCGAMAPNVADELRSSYFFLRRLENFIQAIRDQQVHDMPAGDDLTRVALAMQMDEQSLTNALARHRDRVAEHFRRVAFRSSRDDAGESAGKPLLAAWKSGADADEWQRVLETAGLAEGGALARLLSAFRSRSEVTKLDATASRRLAEFIVLLLQRLVQRESPHTIAERMLLIVERILRRSAYIAMLNENTAILSRLIDLCEQSAYFAEEIGRYPILLDEMLDPRVFSTVLTAEQMRADIADRMRQVEAADSEARVSMLGQYQRATLFRIAIADYSGTLPIMKVSDALTELAELVVREALAVAWSDLSARHGEPWFEEGGRRQRAGFAAIAYGKLGGIELSYGSDLDLVFLHDSRGSKQQTDGPSALENSVFFGRLVRRLVHFLTTQTPTGALYDIDTRLRPSGRSGLLVTSVEAFGRYQVENAWTWEHQALLRSRPVAGHVAVCREFSRIRRETLCQRIDRARLAAEVLKMRARMREQLDRSTGTEFDLKHGLGGIGDIEFLVQFLALESAAERPEVIFYPDNIRQLGALASIGRLPSAEAASLQSIYREYRARAHRLALDTLPPLVDPAVVAGPRAEVSAIWEREFASSGAP